MDVTRAWLLFLRPLSAATSACHLTKLTREASQGLVINISPSQIALQVVISCKVSGTPGGPGVPISRQRRSTKNSRIAVKKRNRLRRP